MGKITVWFKGAFCRGDYQWGGVEEALLVVDLSDLACSVVFHLYPGTSRLDETYGKATILTFQMGGQTNGKLDFTPTSPHVFSSKIMEILGNPCNY